MKTLFATTLVLSVSLFACGPMEEVDSGNSDSQPPADSGPADSGHDAGIPMSDPQCVSNIQYGPCTQGNGQPGACTVGTEQGVEVTTCQPCGGAGQVECARIDPLCGVTAQDGQNCGGLGTCVWHDVNIVTCDACGHSGEMCCEPSGDLRTWFCGGATACQNLYTNPGC